MTANNMSQLRTMLMKEMTKAMNIVSEKSLAAMYEETGEFYTSGEPKMYDRTGALGDTPKTTPVSSVGDCVSFEAYLDTNHQYTTGKKPSMEDVLKLANNGITNSSVGKLSPTVGEGHFWEDSEEKMGNILNNTMSNFFK